MITSQSRFQPFLRQLTECLCWGHLGFWSKRKSLRKSTPLLFAHAVAVQLMGQPCFSCTIMVMALKPWKLHAEVGVQNSRCLLFLFFNTSFFFFSSHTEVEWVHENGTYSNLGTGLSTLLQSSIQGAKSKRKAAVYLGLSVTTGHKALDFFAVIRKEEEPSFFSLTQLCEMWKGEIKLQHVQIKYI